MIGLVDGNNFFVSCGRVFNRRLAGRPVAALSSNDGLFFFQIPYGFFVGDFVNYPLTFLKEEGKHR